MNVQLDPKLKNELVDAAESVATKIWKDNQASQLRNMIQICQTESELKVIENFIRYQAARTGDAGGFWQPIHEEVIEKLREIADRFSTEETELRRVAMQTFFGFLHRRYVYDSWVRKKEGNKDRRGRRHS